MLHIKRSPCKREARAKKSRVPTPHPASTTREELWQESPALPKINKLSYCFSLKEKQKTCKNKGDDSNSQSLQWPAWEFLQHLTGFSPLLFQTQTPSPFHLELAWCASPAGPPEASVMGRKHHRSGEPQAVSPAREQAHASLPSRTSRGQEKKHLANTQGDWEEAHDLYARGGRNRDRAQEEETDTDWKAK